MGPAAAGAVFAVPCLAVVAGGPIAARIATGPRPIAVLAGLTAAGTGAVAALPAAAGPSAALALLGVCGPALGTANALALIAVARSAPAGTAGSAAGIAKTAVTAAGGAAMAGLPFLTLPLPVAP